MKKLQAHVPPPAPTLQDSAAEPKANERDNEPVRDAGGIDSAMFDNLHNHLATLQEEQVRLAGQLANMLDDTKDEFNRKQVFKLNLSECLSFDIYPVIYVIVYFFCFLTMLRTINFCK